MASVQHEREPSPRRARSAESSPLRMARLIEGEIIPRLLLAHRAERERPTSGTIALSEPRLFAEMSLNHEVFALLDHVERLLTAVPIEAIYLDLLAPAARVLGELWENDICDFVDVTMGMWRLQQVIHELGNRAPCLSARTRADRRVLFTVPPGNQHSFGLVMVDDFFRRAGWRTWTAPDATLRDLCGIVGRQWFELVGLTVSTTAHLADLPVILREVRRASQNPAVGIMVGGPVFVGFPERAAAAGADGTAPDAPGALHVAEQLVERRGHRVAAS